MKRVRVVNLVDGDTRIARPVISVIRIGSLVRVGCNNSPVAIVVDVGKEVVQNAGHFDGCEGSSIAALLGDAVASAEVVAGAARQHAGAFLTRGALNALVGGAVVAAAAAIVHITIGPDAAVVGAGGGTGCVARVAHAGVIGAGAVAAAGRGGGAGGGGLALREAPRCVSE